MSIQALLGDMSCASFIEDYYQKLPFSQQGTASHLCKLGQWDVLAAILANTQADVLVCRQNEQYSGPMPRDTDSARKLTDEGFTILVRHAEQHHVGLQELAAAFQRDFGATVNIHLYATPPQQFGFGWHYDAEEVFIVQTTGNKQYSLRKNTVHPWPTSDTLPLDMQYEREVMPLMRCRLQAGDWLYIPSGYWHMGAAAEESISLAIGVLSPTAIDLYDHLRRELLESIFWRQRLPVVGGVANMNRETMKEHLRQLCHQMADDLGKRLRSPTTLERLVDRWMSGSTGQS